MKVKVEIDEGSVFSLVAWNFSLAEAPSFPRNPSFGFSELRLQINSRSEPWFASLFSTPTTALLSLHFQAFPLLIASLLHFAYPSYLLAYPSITANWLDTIFFRSTISSASHGFPK
jgi:hypothetical protein